MNLNIDKYEMSVGDMSRSPIDAELVDAAKRGSRDAFAELVQRHSARLFRTLLQILRDGEDARDAMQDTFLKAFTHLDSFEGKSKFSTWLTRIGINTALMELRKRRMCSTLSLEREEVGNGTKYLELIDYSVNIHDACETAELSEHLRRAIKKLQPKLRDVLELKLNCDCSHEEIATMLCTSVATAKSRIFRAKLALNESLRRRRELPVDTSSHAHL